MSELWFDRPAERVRRALQHFDWVSATELYQVLDLPTYDFGRNPVAYAHRTALSRLVAKRTVLRDESVQPPLYRLNRSSRRKYRVRKPRRRPS